MQEKDAAIKFLKSFDEALREFYHSVGKDYAIVIGQKIEEGKYNYTIPLSNPETVAIEHLKPIGNRLFLGLVKLSEDELLLTLKV